MDFEGRQRRHKLGVKVLGPFQPGIVPKSPSCRCQFEGGSEDFPRERGKIEENRALTGVNRSYFGVNGQLSAVKINKFPGLSQDCVGGEHLFMCFFSGHSLWGRKSINKVPPKNPGAIP